MNIMSPRGPGGPPLPSDLVSRIRQAVLVLGWTQAKTARAFEVSTTTVNRIIAGQSHRGVEPASFDPERPLEGL